MDSFISTNIFTGEPGVPTIEEWLGEQLKEQTLKKVGACPYFFGNCKLNTI
jgi:hypothetical protein